jgi:hypothetical protein
MFGRMLKMKDGQPEEQDGAPPVDGQLDGGAPPPQPAARDRLPRQRYAKSDDAGAPTLSFRPSQVGVHSIAARRREHAVAAEWTETHSAWERQMASLRDSLNDERQASCAGDGQRSGGDAAAAATVNAFLVETEVLESVRIGRPAADSRPPSTSGGSFTPEPDISPLSARSPAGTDRRRGRAADDDEDALMDAILLEAG